MILADGFVVMIFSGGCRFALGLMLKTMTDEMGWTRSSLAGMGSDSAGPAKTRGVGSSGKVTITETIPGYSSGQSIRILSSSIADT